MDPIQNAVHWTLSYKSNLLLYNVRSIMFIWKTGSEEQSLRKMQSVPHKHGLKELAMSMNTKDYFL